MPDGALDSAHVSPDTIAAYAEGRASAPVRDTVERHLAECAECRRDVALVVRLRRRSVRRWALPAASVAAAAVLVVMVSRGWSPDQTLPEPGVRATPGAGSALAVVSPDSVIDAGTSAFTWRPAPGAARYAFTLATPDGRPIFTTETADTSLALPPAVTLEPGRSYLWFVDALTTDGRTATSGLQSLRTRP